MRTLIKCCSEANENILNEISADFLSQLLRKSQVDEKLSSMSTVDKLNYSEKNL